MNGEQSAPKSFFIYNPCSNKKSNIDDMPKLRLETMNGDQSAPKSFFIYNPCSE